MLQNFRTHSLAVEFYQDCKRVALPAYGKDQLRRAAFSVALNLAEGYGRDSLKDRVRFYTIALGSLRECQSVIQLEDLKQLSAKADHLGACLWKLVHQ
ncbi:MAG TPA: four helix bundle protein [Bdellovibrionota bacterium]|nr:four helix bundle protein [Bdellovibrionota bacterium]